MDPAVAALDFAKAGAVLDNMIESYLPGGRPAVIQPGGMMSMIADQRL